jgi:CheY-like chemotaxis protein
MQSLRILLVDDSLEFLELIARFLATHNELDVVGCTTSVHQALQQISALKPDLVLMDLAMPQISGLEATRRIKTAPQAPRVIVMTLYDTDEHQEAARRVQADGFISKSMIVSQFLPTLSRLFPEHAGR